MCLCVRMCVCMCVYVCMYVCMCVCMCVCIFACVCMYACVRMYVCVLACVYYMYNIQKLVSKLLMEFLITDFAKVFEVVIIMLHNSFT